VAAALEKLTCFALAVVLCGCGQKSAAVRIAAQPPSTNNYPTHFAQWLGYFHDEGVEVSISQIAGASKVLEAVVAGSAEVGGGVYEQTIQMAAEGREVVSFVSMLRSPNFAIVGRAKSAAELKGKVVGVSSPGSPSQFYVNHLLIASGVRPEDVSFAGVGMGGTAVAALENGRVDEAVLFGSAITAAVSRGKYEVLADSRTPEGLRKIFGVGDYPASCLLSRGEWLKANPDAARRVAKAVLRSLAWIRAHSAEEILAKVPAEFRVGDPAAELEAIRAAKAMYSADGQIQGEMAEAVRKVLAESVPAVRDAKIDLSRTYTNEFVR
jgi:NitT/TauT family transport system substrate-binding protein